MAQKSVIAVFSESQIATNYGAGMAIIIHFYIGDTEKHPPTFTVAGLF